MFRTIFLCLAFILTNSVMAQAALHPSDYGIARLQTNTWVATHAAQIQLDGMDVIAALEAVENDIEVPAIMANNFQTLVPLASMKKTAFRVVLTAIDNPSLSARFALNGRNININGETRFAFISQDSSRDFQFVILAQKDGTYHAAFTRKLGQDDTEEGEFFMAPLPRILQE